MPHYTIRVELFDSNEGDYLLLNRYMKETGFDREVTIEGVRCELPAAEYSYVGRISFDRVFQTAIYTAELIGRQCKVLVTKSNGPSQMYNSLIEKAQQYLEPAQDSVRKAD